MKVKIQIINAATKRVEYDIYKDDGTTLIQSGESVDYSEAIPNPGAATFTDFAAVVIGDATAKKDTLIATLNSRKSEHNSMASVLASSNAELDSQITDLGTAVSAFA